MDRSDGQSPGATAGGAGFARSRRESDPAARCAARDKIEAQSTREQADNAGASQRVQCVQIRGTQ